MADPTDTPATPGGVDPDALQESIDEFEGAGRRLGPREARIFAGVAFSWAVFQLWTASPMPFWVNGFVTPTTFDPSAGIFSYLAKMFFTALGGMSDVPKRAVHLGFGLFLSFLMFPPTKKGRTGRLGASDMLLAGLGVATTLYLFLGWDGIVRRTGILYDWIPAPGLSIPVEAIIGGIGILVLLEATRRAVGFPLVIVCAAFLIFSVFGQSMPRVISHKGLSLETLIGYQWLGGEAIFGIPLSVSTNFVFLFVMFGALLERAGGARYFLDLAFALVGRYRGGPAKAAILASGMTGAISGSSIANVVTTGMFTIPVMKRTGFPAVKAGAIEVAASTNGQLMPPIMGAAAFIIAEFVGIQYVEVVVAAAIPAVISYMALLYISHLEALKLGLKGLPPAQVPRLGAVFFRGIHYLLPIAVLVWLLLVERWSTGTSVFYSSLSMMGLIVIQEVIKQVRPGTLGLWGGVAHGLICGAREIAAGMTAGARNMVPVAIAVAAAGIIVGAVGSTGLNNALIIVVERISGGNVYILLGMVALLSLVLGMGLPTTANYLVVASLLAGVVVELGSAAGLVLPLLAVHLYVFYFGLMADSTPPVCLAAYAASAISRANPFDTGVQSFLYDIRTSILPVVFIFNPQLLLIGVTSFWEGAMVFVVSLLAILSFASLTQRWMLVRLRWFEMAFLLVVTIALFRPDFVMNRIYPAYQDAPLERFVSGLITPEPGRRVRLHVVRPTNYGDRFKLFVLETPQPSRLQTQGPYGITLGRAGDGTYFVDSLAFGGVADKIGLEFDDIVTAVDVEQLDRPPAALVYPLALALLGLVVLAQYMRWRREEEAVAVSATRDRSAT